MGKLRIMSLVVWAIVIFAGLANAEKAGKVCVAHEGEESIENILISENALDAHLAHGDLVVDAVDCMEVCIDHKGDHIAISANELKEHQAHGDTEVNAQLCLEE